jgi:enamine deaminase RidA (YjgF/YER057c/UK114 family)
MILISVPPEEALKKMGLELPPTSAPRASYVPAVKAGRFVYLSGCLPFLNGNLLFEGKIDRDLTVEQGYHAAQLSALHLLSALKSVVPDLADVERIVRVTGYVASSEGFRSQHLVVNGASDLLKDVFGKKGNHSRIAIGTFELPLGAPVEIELIATIRK